jgi:hypothetical protein
MLACTSGLLAVWGTSSSASAGVPECGGAHVEVGASCEVVASLSCEATCDVDRVIDACAAELAAICSGGCTLDADISCTGDCGSTCDDRCRVEDLVCENGCIEECAATCPDQCATADDVGKCISSCESTCSVNCDQKCGELPPDAKCVEHCNQCCLGSCTGQINFDCQFECQAPLFVECQERMLDLCEGSCSGSGSLFCDGQFLAGGSSVIDCADALMDRGIAVRWMVEPPDLDEVEIDGGSAGFCRVGSHDSTAPGGLLALICLAGLGRRRQLGRSRAQR